MPDPDYKALCEELMNEAIYLGSIPYDQAPNPELIAQARAALAQPEPVAPTDEGPLAMFNNYCEARTNREKALSNYRKAEVGRDQANALYLETQKTWLQADGMLESIEEDCREAGFDPTRYFKDKNND